ncbi:MAG: hypothetical protein RRY64_10700, partial [Oscillospiraceae bacterium]
MCQSMSRLACLRLVKKWLFCQNSRRFPDGWFGIMALYRKNNGNFKFWRVQIMKVKKGLSLVLSLVLAAQLCLP